MRVTFFGEVTADVRLVEGLAKRTDLTLFVSDRQGQELSQPPVGVLQGTRVRGSRLQFAASVARRLLARDLDRPDAAIVQNQGVSALAANIASRLRGVPVVMLVCSPQVDYYVCRKQANDPRIPYRRSGHLALLLLMRLNGLFGRHAVTLSHHLAQRIIESGFRGSVSVIPVYGVDLTAFSPPSSPRQTLRRELGLPENGQIVFFSSRVAPEKDVGTLMRAVATLLRQGHDLWLINRSGGFRDFISSARYHGIDHRVIATDAVDPRTDLPATYQAADVCVQSSRAEGLGFSALEAMACGTPVIASAVGGLKEFVRPGETGWTYRPGDSNDLADRLSEVLQLDTAEHARVTKNAIDLVKDRYTSTVALEGFLQKLLSIAG